MESPQLKRSRRVYVACYVLAGIAFITGLVLELLWDGSFVEGLIVAFGLFLAGQNRDSSDRINDRLDEVIKRLDRLIEK